MGILADVIALKDFESRQQDKSLSAISNLTNTLIAGSQFRQQQQLAQLQQQNLLSEIKQRESGINELLQLRGVADLAKNTGNEELMRRVNSGVNQLLGQGSAQDQLPRQSLVDDVLQSPPQPPKVSGFLDNQNVTSLIPDPLFEQAKEKDVFGELTPEAEVAQIKLQEQAKDEVEQLSKLRLGQLVSVNNLSLIAGTARDLSQVYADAFREGGAGGAIQKFVGDTATKIGDLPEFLGGVQIGSKFARSGSFDGKKSEMVLKLTPMLTQQPTKPEGSIRLITGVLEAINVTLPELGVAPLTARNQLSESLTSFFRFARATKDLGLEFDKVFQGKEFEEIDQNEITAWAQQVQSLADTIEITGKEKEALNNFINTAVEPIDEVIELQRKQGFEIRTTPDGNTTYKVLKRR